MVQIAHELRTDDVYRTYGNLADNAHAVEVIGEGRTYLQSLIAARQLIDDEIAAMEAD